MIALVGAGPTLGPFRALILWDSFTIVCVSEDSRFFMRESDVEHCARVSLTRIAGPLVPKSYAYPRGPLMAHRGILLISLGARIEGQ